MSWGDTDKPQLRPALYGVFLLGVFCAPVQAAPEGDTAADIIQGCNQFIKFSRKGTPPRDGDKLRRLGECVGAVRSTLAFGVRDNDVCPPPQRKLIDAVTAFSAHILRHPYDLEENYVVVIRKALIAAWPCGSSRSL